MEAKDNNDLMKLTQEVLVTEIAKLEQEKEGMQTVIAQNNAIIHGLLSGVNNGNALQNAIKYLNRFDGQLQDASLTVSVMVKLLLDKGVFTMEEFQAEGNAQFEASKKQEEEEKAVQNEKGN